MESIFGISNLPISTIMSPFETVMEFRNPYEDELEYAIKQQFNKNQNYGDVFCHKNPVTKSNPIIKKRNGFGKIMKHFSKKL